MSRLASLTNNLANTANDLTIGTLAYNPASQIASAPRSNDAYAWTGSVAVNRGYTANGLNQFTAVGGNCYTYDLRGNLTADGSNTFGYSSENLLTSATVAHVSTSFTYDPLLRLYQGVAGTITSRLAYDGLDRIAEYNGSDALQRRYVFGPGMDAPIIWYEGATVSSTTRRFLSSDERGSIVSVTDSSGALLGINEHHFCTMHLEFA